MTKSKRIAVILSIGILSIITVLFCFYVYLDRKSGGKSVCHDFELVAYNISASIYNYFDNPDHNSFPKPNQLTGIDDIIYPWEISDKRDKIIILVKDVKGICPIDYQNASSGWNKNIFTLTIDKEDMFKSLNIRTENISMHKNIPIRSL